MNNMYGSLLGTCNKKYFTIVTSYFATAIYYLATVTDYLTIAT